MKYATTFCGVLGTVVLATTFSLLAGCGGGGGGGGGGTTPTDGGGTGGVDVTYNAAANIGDLLTYTLNTTTRAYSYNFVAGSLQGTSHSGTLTPVPGYGDYVYETDQGAEVVLFPNNLIVGVTPGTDLFAGVPRLTTNYTVSECIGVYNYVDIIGNNSSYGTFQVGDGVWSRWSMGNASGTPSETGTWEDQGDGVIYAYEGTTKVANVMILPASGGGKTLILDYPSGGMGIGVKQQSVSSGAVNGTYDVLDTQEDGLYQATVNGTTVSFSPPGWQSLTVEYNSPWTGFVSTPEESGIWLGTPDGIFVGGYTENGLDYIAAGIKQ